MFSILSFFKGQSFNFIFNLQSEVFHFCYLLTSKYLKKIFLFFLPKMVSCYQFMDIQYFRSEMMLPFLKFSFFSPEDCSFKLPCQLLSFNQRIRGLLQIPGILVCPLVFEQDTKPAWDMKLTGGFMQAVPVVPFGSETSHVIFFRPLDLFLKIFLQKRLFMFLIGMYISAWEPQEPSREKNAGSVKLQN